jgi:hypothetical protein
MSFKNCWPDQFRLNWRLRPEGRLRTGEYRLSRERVA